MGLATAFALERTDEPVGQEALWCGVDRLIDRAPTLADLKLHRLHLLAVARWQALGRRTPPELVDDARNATLAAFAAPLLLGRVRTLVDGPIVLLKGPEIAARYPQRFLRPFGDLDLLVQDPVAVQHALVEAGFAPVGDERVYRGIHHLRPLHYPSFPLVLEIHARPKWIHGVRQPPVAEVFDAAVPSVVGIDGLLAPLPAHHALLLAAHGWAHTPLGRLLDLIDIAAIRAEASPDELTATADRWGLRRLWRLTDRTIDALLLDESRPLPLRLWARHLEAARGRTVLESHLTRWLQDFSLLPFRRALAASGRAVRRDLAPSPDEGWSEKLARTRLAVRNARLPRELHSSQLPITGGLEDDAP